jgi:hypothetical protein
MLMAARNQPSTLALLICFHAPQPATFGLMLASHFGAVIFVQISSLWSPFFHYTERCGRRAGSRDRRTLNDSLRTDGANLAGHVAPAHSEGSIHATRDSAKEIVALLRSLINSVKR